MTLELKRAEDRELRVMVILQPNIDKPDEEDEAIPGLYSVTVDGDLSDGDATYAALEAFHGKFAIAYVDDFDVWVYDPATGLLLEEADEPDVISIGRDVEYLTTDVPEAFPIMITHKHAQPETLLPIIADNAEQAMEFARQYLRNSEPGTGFTLAIGKDEEIPFITREQRPASVLKI